MKFKIIEDSFPFENNDREIVGELIFRNKNYCFLLASYGGKGFCLLIDLEEYSVPIIKMPLFNNFEKAFNWIKNNIDILEEEINENRILFGKS